MEGMVIEGIGIRKGVKKSERVELKWLHVPVRETTENGSHQRTQPMTANRTYFVIFIT